MEPLSPTVFMVFGQHVNEHTHTHSHQQTRRIAIYLLMEVVYILKGDMFVCGLPMAGRTAGPIKTKLGIGTHVDPGSVLVKVKVIYLRVWYNRIHACDT